MPMIKRERDSLGRPVCRSCGIHISGRGAYCPRCGLEAAAASKSLWEARHPRPTYRKRKKPGLTNWNL
jgi:predicted amidophosphoribosyltransferase